MRVLLNEVRGSDPPAVVVTAPGVRGRGLWRGEANPPTGTEVDVELEVPGQIKWQEVVISLDMPGSLMPVGDELLVHGVVESIDDDRVVSLRIADAVVLIDTIGAPPAGVVGEHVAMVARHVGLYPTGA